ncbi:hypothetical protein FOL47_010303 [Perkinsus chesapeaki]|uniref:non-specific serine/threonine protein kinase n=1 Tax=Perkinsus chesapeaki TaxID=330153 RepID=A0A7J6MQE7_PERCH|nr:hypothetical protein FOL47_010303 [Perkinsus chesapeaki]
MFHLYRKKKADDGQDETPQAVRNVPANRPARGGKLAKVRIPAAAFNGNNAGRRKRSETAASPFHKVPRTDMTNGFAKKGGLASSSESLFIFPTLKGDALQDEPPQGCALGHDLSAVRWRKDRAAFESLRCPKRHELKEFVADQPGYVCNVCDSEALKKGAQILGCRKCDFDMCGKCVEVGCKAISVSSNLVDHPTPADFNRLHCPNRHTLKRFKILNGAHSCGCCDRSSLPRGTEAFSCDKCSYELCFDCAYSDRVPEYLFDSRNITPFKNLVRLPFVRPAGKSLIAFKSGTVSSAGKELLDNGVDNFQISGILEDKQALMEHCARWFKTYDVNKDGYLSFVELTDLCGQLLADLDVPGMDKCTVQQYMKKYDVDGDERLTPKEFHELFNRILLKAKAIHTPFALKRRGLLGRAKGLPSGRYTLREDLGHGSFGAAQKVIDKLTKEERVMKTISKTQGHTSQEELELEIECMKKMDHPHILKLFEYYEDANNMYLILDICEGGHLLGVIEDSHRSRNRKPMSERWICEAFRQVLDAVAHCHMHGLIHKDIKAENILLMSKAPPGSKKKVFELKPHVVLIDFGLAELFDPSRAFHSKVVAGTPYTMAPEVWASAQNRTKTFGLKCDVYSLGCVLFHILTGKIPVLPKSNHTRDWIRAIEAGPNWSLVDSTGASKEVRKLVRSMMSVSESNRPSSRECLESDWFRLNPDEHVQRLSPVAVKEIAEFSKRSAFEKAVLMDVATQVHALSIPDINSIFTSLDEANIGVLSADKVAVGLKNLGVDQSVAEKAVKAMDMDGNGEIDYTELVAGLLCAYDDHVDRLLWAAFRNLDKDNDGRLDRSEVSELLRSAKQGGSGCIISDNDIGLIIDELDRDQDGYIQYHEFRARFTPKGSTRSLAGCRRLLASRTGLSEDEHGSRSYLITIPDDEDDFRFNVFSQTVKFIDEVNAQNLSYKLAINENSAMTLDEISAARCCSLTNNSQDVPEGTVANHLPRRSLGGFPTDLSWVKRGAVNPPSNQGDCNSCYAMVTLGAIEGAFQIKIGHLPKLSAQQIVDCSIPWGNRGCEGGTIGNTATYVNLNGIVSDKDYPYATKKQDCSSVVYDFDKACLEAGDLLKKGSVIMPSRKLDVLMQELQSGPIALTLFSNTPEFIHYRSEILDIPNCKGDPDHAMLLVGYGVEGGKDYWILKDSYGTQRGENGYIRVARDPTKTDDPGFCNMLLDTAYRPVLNKVLKSTACRS